MEQSRGLARFAPLSGVAFVVFALAGAIVESSGEPSDFPGDVREIVSYYTDHSSSILVGAYLGLLGVVFLIWFVGVLRARLRVAEGVDGSASAIAFGGGVAAAAMALGVHATNAGAAFRADEDNRIAPGQATALFDLQSGFFIAFAFALAVLIAATAVVALRTGALPRWIGYLSAVFAIGLIEPFANWLFVIASPLWFLPVSILLYLRPAERTPAGTA
jgi:hypothetical protein